MTEFLERYPWVLGLAVFLWFAVALTYPLPVLAVTGLAGVCWGVSTWHDKRHMTKVGLARRADYEHWLLMNTNREDN